MVIPAYVGSKRFLLAEEEAGVNLKKYGFPKIFGDPNDRRARREENALALVGECTVVLTIRP